MAAVKNIVSSRELQQRDRNECIGPPKKEGVEGWMGAFQPCKADSLSFLRLVANAETFSFALLIENEQ